MLKRRGYNSRLHNSCRECRSTLQVIRICDLDQVPYAKQVELLGCDGKKVASVG